MKTTKDIDTLCRAVNGISLITSQKQAAKTTPFKTPRSYYQELINMRKRKYVLNIDKGDVIRSRSQ